MLISALWLLLPGCARTPTSSSTVSTKLLTFTLGVQGKINPNDFYYVVINNANDANGSVGPVPVVGYPWGNGFVAGSATSFIEYTGSQPADGYLIYNFTPSTANPLLQFSPNGTPTQDTQVTSTTSSLEFQIPLSDLATTAVPTKDITSIQINFITTNQVPTNTFNTLSTPKLFDALGNMLNPNEQNEFITIPTTQDATYSSNSGANGVQQGAVASTTGSGVTETSDPDAPNLDIVNWSVQVSN